MWSLIHFDCWHLTVTATQTFTSLCLRCYEVNMTSLSPQEYVWQGGELTYSPQFSYGIQSPYHFSVNKSEENTETNHELILITSIINVSKALYIAVCCLFVVLGFRKKQWSRLISEPHCCTETCDMFLHYREPAHCIIFWFSPTLTVLLLFVLIRPVYQKSQCSVPLWNDFWKWQYIASLWRLFKDGK